MHFIGQPLSTENPGKPRELRFASLASGLPNSRSILKLRLMVYLFSVENDPWTVTITLLYEVNDGEPSLVTSRIIWATPSPWQGIPGNHAGRQAEFM